MRRNKRLGIIRIGLAMATLTMMLPVAAQAKPMPRDSIRAEYQARAVPVIDTQRVEIPYLSQGVGVTEAELGIVTSKSPDDRSFPRTYDEQPVLVSDGGSSFDVNTYAVTGFGLALVLMAGGMGLAIRHSRKSKLAPA
jgi:hypothetical protein